MLKIEQELYDFRCPVLYIPDIGYEVFIEERIVGNEQNRPRKFR